MILSRKIQIKGKHGIKQVQVWKNDSFAGTRSYNDEQNDLAAKIMNGTSNNSVIIEKTESAYSKTGVT